VHSPGGILDVELGEDGIVLGGPTQKVGDVTVDEAVLAGLVAGLDTAGLDTAGLGTAGLDAAGNDTAVREAAEPAAAPDEQSTEVATRQ
jgi:hypothetical protein